MNPKGSILRGAGPLSRVGLRSEGDPPLSDCMEHCELVRAHSPTLKSTSVHIRARLHTLRTATLELQRGQVLALHRLSKGGRLGPLPPARFPTAAAPAIEIWAVFISPCASVPCCPSLQPRQSGFVRCLIRTEGYTTGLCASHRALDGSMLPDSPGRGQRSHRNETQQVCRHPNLLPQKLVCGPVDQSTPGYGNTVHFENDRLVEFLERREPQFPSAP